MTECIFTANGGAVNGKTDELPKKRLATAVILVGKAAKLLGLDQPKVSALVRGLVEGCSLDRLFRLLHAVSASRLPFDRAHAIAKRAAVVVT